MSIDDERELRQRLGAALDTITPRPAPVDAVVRQGRNFMMRRRIAVVAGAAAVAVVGLTAPGWLHLQSAGPPPAAPLVTVVRPGPHPAAGLIASGVVGTRHWRAVAEKPAKNNQCFQAGELFCGPPLRPAAPVTFGEGGGTNGLTVQIGAVRPDVARVELRLADGAVLVLHPVRAYGARLVAFAVPSHLGVAEATAYSKRSELAYAIPFNSQGTPSFITWLRPGEPGHQRATYQIGSGVINGRAWSQTEYVGPWGRCFTGAGQNTACLLTFGSLVSPGQLTVVSGEPGPGGVAGLYTVAAAPSVQSVRLTLSDGHAISPRVVKAGGQKFYAFGISKGVRVLRWTAYGSSGQQLGSGTGAGGGDG
jgi:hypothetical protein